MRRQQQRKPNGLNRRLAPLFADETLVAVVELNLTGWLVVGVVPGVARQPVKKPKPEHDLLLELLQRWRSEAERRGHRFARIAIA